MKTLTTDELVTALRSELTCDDCICAAECNHYICLLFDTAADMLENHASDRAALVAEIEKLRKQLEQTQAERDVLRNELRCKCGNYREAHNGACDGCRWKEAAQ